MMQQTKQPPEHTTIKRIEHFEAPFLEEALLDKEAFNSSEEYREAFEEFKKYLVLSVESDASLGMPSEAVDAVWHQFILFTKQYHEFCTNVLGYYLHHAPNTSETPMDEQATERFIQLYQERYGELPDVWDVADGACKSDCGCEEGKCEGT